MTSLTNKPDMDDVREATHHLNKQNARHMMADIYPRKTTDTRKKADSRKRSLKKIWKAVKGKRILVRNTILDS